MDIHILHGKRRDRPRLHDVKLPCFIRPLDIAGETVMILDADDDFGELEDLVIGEFLETSFLSGIDCHSLVLSSSMTVLTEDPKDGS